MIAQYEDYLGSEQWKATRQKAIERAGYRCQVCNSPDALQAHHRTYERLGTELPEDLTVLCEDCHTLYHEHNQAESLVALEDAIAETYTQIDKRAGGSAQSSGIQTGFDDLDQLTSGLQNSKLIVVASRPGMGKTAIVLNFVRHAVVDQRSPVLIFSMEQTRLEISEQLLAAHARVYSHRLREGNLSGDDVSKLTSAGEMLRNGPLFIDDSPRRHLPHIVATSGRLVKEKGVKAVFIDSLDLIEPPNSRVFCPEQIALVCRRLKRLARELNVPIIVTVGVNRTSEDRQDHRPRLADLRECGAIEQYADMCLMLHRPGVFDGGVEDNIIEVIVAKQRNGPTGEVMLIYLKQYGRFENYSGDFGVQ